MDEEDHSVVSMLYISSIHMEASGTYSLMVTNADNAETKDFMVAVGDYEEEVRYSIKGEIVCQQE